MNRFLIVAAALGVAFLRPAVPSAVAADGEIVLGAAISQSGKYAREGKFYVDAYTIAVDAVNKAGGVKVGGKSHKLALKLYDDQSDPALSARLDTKLVTSDKVNFLLGPYTSGIAIAASAISEKYEIPMVQGGGAAGNIFDHGYKYIFGTLANAELYLQPAVELAARSTPAARTAALLFSNEAFDKAVAKGTRKWLQQAKIDLVYDEEYQPATQDFSSVLTVIKSKNPDLVLVAGHEENSLNFIRQSQAADVNPKMAVFTVGPPTGDFRKTLGKAAEYVYGVTTWLPEMDLPDATFGSAGAFAKQFQARFAYEPDYHVASGVADVLAFKYAIEKAASLDPKKVRDALAALDAPTLYGRIKFNSVGQIELPQTLIQIQHGRLVSVYAGGKALARPLYPTPPWAKR
ncbi:MAG TPA: amino acid ABC transporter substrate-binding protein [Polyangia bacterium]|nr:amino acid ABC transporter substrate-binding protein [Polyangia bacterium]